MSRPVLAAVPDLPQEVVDPRLGRLVEVVDQHWRPAEWDSQRLILRVDPDGPLAHGRRCRVTGCTKTSRSHHGLCAVCRRDFTASGATDQELWLQSAVRTTPLRGEQSFRDLRCSIEFDGTRCARPALTRTQGLCQSHDGRLRRALRLGRSAEEWFSTAKPLPPNPPCRAETCDNQQQSKRMCNLHYSRWAQAGRPQDIDAWLVGQSHPVLNGLELWLGGLPTLALHEFLYVLQMRDRGLHKLNLSPPRILSRAMRDCRAGSLLALDPADFTGETPTWLRQSHDLLSTLYRDKAEEHQQDVWDLRVLGLHAGREKGTRPLLVDFRPIRQPWLRAMSKDWIATGGVNRSDTIRDCIRSTAMLSDAIAVGPGHDDPTKLSRADISRFVTALKATELGASRKSKFLYAARQFVTHARRDSWLEGVPRTFDFLPSDTIEGDEADDDDLVGKALPEPIIRQLDQHVGMLRATVHRLPLGKELTTELRLLAYQLLRDTGRRVSDLAALLLDPIVHEGDEYTLVFDNIKARRRGRKLPIDKSTADAIAQVGDMVAATFPNTPRKDLPLFPRPTRNPYGTKRTTGAGLADWMEAWFNRIPPLLDDHLDSDGGMSPFPLDARTTDQIHRFFQQLGP